jgi:hypothetical protein
MVNDHSKKAVTALEVSVDAVLTTAKVAVVEGATIETKVSLLGTEIARLGAIPGAKSLRQKLRVIHLRKKTTL